MTYCPPPPNFRPVKGLKWAKFAAAPPPFLKKPPTRGAKSEGVRYERKVQQMLLARFPGVYVDSPWIQFEDAHGRRWCQPDGMLLELRAGMCIVVEVKYRHTPDAWWGLWQLYKPVLEYLLPTTLWRFGCLEIVKWYDPVTPFPAGIALTDTPLKIPRANLTAVHIWNPSRGYVDD